MQKGLYVLPIVFFTAMCAFLVSYNASTAPLHVTAQIRAEALTAPSEDAPGEPVPETSDTERHPTPLPELEAYPELNGVKINVNTADSKALEQLPGIGPKKAQAIMDYVSANGPLSSVDELLGIKGIGEKTLEALRPYITVTDT